MGATVMMNYFLWPGKLKNMYSTYVYIHGKIEILHINFLYYWAQFFSPLSLIVQTFQLDTKNVLFQFNNIMPVEAHTFYFFTFCGFGGYLLYC